MFNIVWDVFIVVAKKNITNSNEPKLYIFFPFINKLLHFKLITFILLLTLK